MQEVLLSDSAKVELRCFFIDKNKIQLFMFGILALCVFNVWILMNPQSEDLRYKSRYMLYRKAQFLYVNWSKETKFKNLIHWLILDSFLQTTPDKQKD